jgi:threonine synthase
MSYLIGFKCFECASSFSPGEIEYVCPDCGANLDALYDYERAGKELNKATLAADRNLTIWRYRALLPIEDLSLAPPLAVGWTPIYDRPGLAAEFGVKRLFIKDDGRNPTASFKDRPSALAVVKAREAGARVVTTASSGNAGSALAGMCASVGMKSVIFAPATTPAAKIAQLQIYGSKVALVEGSYDEAFDLCLEAGRRYGWYQRSTGYNPFMAEGKKTAALEIGEQLNWEVPDKVFVAVGDGCVIGGMWKGFNELHRLGLIDRLPQMIGVQAEGASAIVDAANGDGVLRAGPARTVADSINVGRPRDATRAIRAIRESKGCGVKVSDDEIIAAVSRLARSTGVFVEPAAAATFAGFVSHCEGGEMNRNESALVTLTGNGLKDVEAIRRAAGEPLRIKPDMAELDGLLSQFGFS